MNKPVDWTKPVQLRDGTPVRVLTTNLKNSDFPVVIAYIEHSGREAVAQRTITGLATDDQRSVVNVPEKLPERWVNFYEKRGRIVSGGACESREIADKHSYDPELIGTRIACIKVSGNVGDGI